MKAKIINSMKNLEWVFEPIYVKTNLLIYVYIYFLF